MATKTSAKVAGDVFLDVPSTLAHRISVDLKTHASGGNQTIAQIPGIPVTVAAGVATLLLTTELAATTHLLVSGDEFSAQAQNTTLTGKYTAVGIDLTGAGGNIVVNEDTILGNGSDVNDPAGSAWVAGDITAVKAALDGLGFSFRTEPTKSTTQAT